MPVLSNPKHELFAQGLLKGKTQIEAYTSAGYKPNPSAASRLAEDVNICERIAELQGRAAIRAEITVASITDRLLKIADLGEAKPNESAMLGVARAALMDAAKLNGLVVDKSEMKLDTLTPEQRADRIATLEARRRERSGGDGVSSAS